MRSLETIAADNGPDMAVRTQHRVLRSYRATDDRGTPGERAAKDRAGRAEHGYRLFMRALLNGTPGKLDGC